MDKGRRTAPEYNCDYEMGNVYWDSDEDEDIRVAKVNSMMDQVSLSKSDSCNSLSSIQTGGACSSKLGHSKSTSDIAAPNIFVDKYDENNFDYSPTDSAFSPDENNTGDEMCLEFTYQSGPSSEGGVVEAGKVSENGSNSLINVTSPEEMQNFLEHFFDHPCEKCKTEFVSHKYDNVWSCESCDHTWGYDDCTDFEKLIRNNLEIPPCHECRNSDAFKISFQLVDGKLEFWCLNCGAGYELRDKKQTQKSNPSKVDFKSDCRPKGETGVTYSKSAKFDRETAADNCKAAPDRRRNWSVDGTVKQQWGVAARALDRSAKTVLSEGCKVLANSTNPNPKNELTALVAREATGLCTPVCVALGTTAGTLLLKSPVGAKIGGTLGALVGNVLSSFISDSLSRKRRR